MLERLLEKLGKKVKADGDLSNLEDPNVLLKRDAYDDCLSCRVLGKMQNQLEEVRVRNSHRAYRFHCFRCTGWLYIFHGHEESARATKND